VACARPIRPPAQPARRAGADTGRIEEPRDLRASVSKSVASGVLRSSDSED